MTGSAPEVVVIGAGLGGLSTAASLAHHGLPVTVLEAQAIPGGCASTFYHQGYKFDTGATLAGGFYLGGPMDLVAQAAGIPKWQTIPADPVMQVHLSDGTIITISGGPQVWGNLRETFGSESKTFWEWQESTADAMWDLALRLPAWPPQSISQLLALSKIGFDCLLKGGTLRLSPSLLRDGFRSVAAHLENANERLTEFIDAQLLISAQTTSHHANALYGAAALDLPRRGVVHIAGGIGTIAETLVQAIIHNGGKVLYHQEAQKVILDENRPRAVVTKRGQYHPADLVISNIPPWNTNQLFSPENQSHPNPRMHPVSGWGAFVLYLGVDAALIPIDFPLHHQVILARPMGEGNTIFLSISPAWDDTRAPQGKRSITISTHTSIETWWKLFDQDRDAYQARKQEYTTKVLAAAETILPGIHEAADLILPGTPVTFQRFTRRARGWVGGFPQTGLLQSIAPYLGRNIWMVGDSIFPGQSIAATSLGGLRVACDILERLDVQKKFKQESKISHDPRQDEQFASGSGFKVSPVTLRGTKKNEMEFS